jgi:hypothetical protein
VISRANTQQELITQSRPQREGRWFINFLRLPHPPLGGHFSDRFQCVSFIFNRTFFPRPLSIRNWSNEIRDADTGQSARAIRNVKICRVWNFMHDSNFCISFEFISKFEIGSNLRVEKLYRLPMNHTDWHVMTLEWQVAYEAAVCLRMHDYGKEKVHPQGSKRTISWKSRNTFGVKIQAYVMANGQSMTKCSSIT